MTQSQHFSHGFGGVGGCSGIASSIAETDCGTVEEFEHRITARGQCDGGGDADVTTATSPAAAPAEAAAPKARILVVDDERRIRLAIRVCLEAEGYEVEEAADGREAISAMVHAAPDLLLLDLAMPNLDGMSTLRLLSSVYDGVAPPVVVLTAHGSIVAAESAYHYGARAFLEKPLIPETLRAVVERVLAERRTGRPGASADAADTCGAAASDGDSDAHANGHNGNGRGGGGPVSRISNFFG